jgi:hypothetical protein
MWRFAIKSNKNFPIEILICIQDLQDSSSFAEVVINTDEGRRSVICSVDWGTSEHQLSIQKNSIIRKLLNSPLRINSAWEIPIEFLARHTYAPNNVESLN